MVTVRIFLKTTTMMIILTLFTNCLPKVKSNFTSADETHCSKTITKNCELLKHNDNKDDDCCDHGYCCKNAGKTNNSYICQNEEICCYKSLHCFKPTKEDKSLTLGVLSRVFTVVPFLIVVLYFIARAYWARKWKRNRSIEFQFQNNQMSEFPTNLQENNRGTNYAA